jgi:hypothetical protein
MPVIDLVIRIGGAGSDERRLRTDQRPRIWGGDVPLSSSVNCVSNPLTRFAEDRLAVFLCARGSDRRYWAR